MTEGFTFSKETIDFLIEDLTALVLHGPISAQMQMEIVNFLEALKNANKIEIDLVS